MATSAAKEDWLDRKKQDTTHKQQHYKKKKKNLMPIIETNWTDLRT